MTIEVLFNEVCGLYGDAQNASYLKACLPDAEMIYTRLNEKPYFVENDPDMILIGTMSEETQRRVIQVLTPWKSRLEALIEKRTVILATGNALEVFCKRISYVTEGIETDGLGIFDYTVVTNLFNRYNGKVLADFEDMTVVGFRSQFSFLHGDNSGNYFLKCQRGIGLNPDSTLEGIHVKNFFGTQLLGPILILNPPFCEYLIRLAGGNASVAFRDAAMDAYQQRLTEFRDPKIDFEHSH